MNINGLCLAENATELAALLEQERRQSIPRILNNSAKSVTKIRNKAKARDEETAKSNMKVREIFASFYSSLRC